MTKIAAAAPRSASPLLALQVLRFFAALLVLVHHAGYDADTLAARIGKAPLGLDRYVDGSFGIHLFFVLSGFIMVYAERDFRRPGAPRRFATRRLIRVVPLYWLMTTLLLFGAWLAPRLLNTPVDGIGSVLGSYLFVPVLRATGDSHPILGQGWTLNYEMMFYLAFAAAMAWPRPVGLAGLTLTFGASVAAGSIWQPRLAALQVWTDPLLLEFLFGVGIALLVLRGRHLSAVSGGLLAVAGVVLAVAFGPALGLAAQGPVWILQGGPAALILAGLALGPPWPATSPVLFLSALGDASYSLYLSHPFAIRPLRDLWLHFGGAHASVVTYLIVACLFAILCALLLFVAVERPMTRRLRRRFDPRPPASTFQTDGPIRGAVVGPSAPRENVSL